jgi:hypothetical protein
MEGLLTGIWERYNAGNTFKTACTGGLHLESAPQKTAIPYATYQLITGRPEYYFAGNHEIALIQFDIYAQSNVVRQDLYSKLIALFDDCRPTVTGYTSIIMERQNQQLVREGDQNDVYRYIVEYAVRIEKT